MSGNTPNSHYGTCFDLRSKCFASPVKVFDADTGQLKNPNSPPTYFCADICTRIPPLSERKELRGVSYANTIIQINQD